MALIFSPPIAGLLGLVLMNFYKTSAWKRKRQIILRRDKYMCMECKRYGRTTEATTVHHIYPINVRADLKLKSENLISLCNACHEKMHNRETDELTETGKKWVRKVGEISPPLKKF